MFFSKKLRLASAFLGVAMLGSVFAGCGSDAGSGDTIKVGANIEMTGNQANYGKAASDLVSASTRVICLPLMPPASLASLMASFKPSRPALP